MLVEVKPSYVRLCQVTPCYISVGTFMPIYARLFPIRSG